MNALPIAAALSLLLAAPASAQQPPPAPATLPAQNVDALTASPDNFRLILENNRVRVLEYSLLPGQRDRRHTHPRRVAHVISGGKLRVHLSDGRYLDFTEIAGTSEWGEPSPLHDSENIGITPIKILLVEVKDGPSR